MNPLFTERRYLIPFRSRLLPQIFCDTLVIGTGIAGLRAALEAANDGEVIVLSKTELPQSSTYLAQGGIAAIISKADTFEEHIQDTLKAGAELCDESAVRQAVESAPRAIEQLRQWGMRFDINEDTGQPMLGREGAHRHPRILHSDGDATGREIVRCLGRQVRSNPSIRLFEECFALDLLTARDGNSDRVYGANTYHPQHGLQMIWASATILATGGIGQIFRETTNSPVATGDGMAMAYRAGAAIADMCFVQFHPTTLYIAGAERSLISEAVRGEGAYLVNSQGIRFMLDVSEQAELAPRDVVSRAISRHLAESGETHVFLDTRHFAPGFFKKRFPGIHEQLRRFDIDPENDLIPVKPSAHYAMGGVWVDKDARSTLPGLYACGEGACTGLHGANRLASNSLLEGLVFGEVAGKASVHERANGGASVVPMPHKVISDIRPSDRSELDLKDVRSSLQAATLRHLGTIRNVAGISQMREMLNFWARYTLDKIFDEPFAWETQNMLLTAYLVCRSASWRKESRGAHAVEEFDLPRDEYRVHDLWTKGADEPIRMPVSKERPALQLGAD